MQVRDIDRDTEKAGNPQLENLDFLSIDGLSWWTMLPGLLLLIPQSVVNLFFVFPSLLEDQHSVVCFMAFMRGEPLVAKLATVAKYVVLPGTMVAALIYSPPRYGSSSKDNKSPK